MPRCDRVAHQPAQVRGDVRRPRQPARRAGAPAAARFAGSRRSSRATVSATCPAADRSARRCGTRSRAAAVRRACSSTITSPVDGPASCERCRVSHDRRTGVEPRARRTASCGPCRHAAPPAACVDAPTPRQRRARRSSRRRLGRQRPSTGLAEPPASAAAVVAGCRRGSRRPPPRPGTPSRALRDREVEPCRSTPSVEPERARLDAEPTPAPPERRRPSRVTTHRAVGLRARPVSRRLPPIRTDADRDGRRHCRARGRSPCTARARPPARPSVRQMSPPTMQMPGPDLARDRRARRRRARPRGAASEERGGDQGEDGRRTPTDALPGGRRAWAHDL